MTVLHLYTSLNFFYFFFLSITVSRTFNTLLNKMASVGILVPFLMLVEMLSTFPPFSILAVSYYICPSLCWNLFPLYPICEEFFYHKWMLNSVNRFFKIHEDYHMIFILPFINCLSYWLSLFLCVVLENNLISFFYKWLTSFPSTTC